MASISIIVPSYNQGHLIAHTLDSILSQGVEDLDVFVADGGSKDATVGVLERYGDRIKWVSERDRGQTDAINKGLRQARGDVVAYINSDDTYEPGAVRRALELLDANPGVEFVYGDANLIDENGGLIEHTHAVDFDIGVLTYDHNFICQPASFWRRSLVQRIGPFDESLQYLMDYEWFLRAAHSGARFLHAREPWANLRLHSACKTVMGSGLRFITAIFVLGSLVSRPNFALPVTISFKSTMELCLVMYLKSFESFNLILLSSGIGKVAAFSAR